MCAALLREGILRSGWSSLCREGGFAQAEANGELLVVLGDENGKDCWPEDTKTPRQERITDREPLRARRDSNPQPSDPKFDGPLAKVLNLDFFQRTRGGSLDDDRSASSASSAG